uniref:Interference hedgehog n=1 Tax=Glossina morsitans morsitans TaxID=37546 RepID=A0ABK9NH39_GLOMM
MHTTFSITRLTSNTCSSASSSSSSATIMTSTSTLTTATTLLTSVAAFLLLSVAINCHIMITEAMPGSSLGVHVVRSPESAVAPKGDEVVFECELNLSPERLKWKFRHSSKRAIDGSNFHYLSVEEGYNVTNEDRTSKLRVFVQLETLGDYQCVAWFGSAAIASTSASLTLVSITIDNSNGYSRNAIRWNVAPKNCALIRCGIVTSNPTAIWNFYRNGEKIQQTDSVPTSGALILNTVTSKDSGNYTCSARNPITGQEVKLPQRIDLRVDYSDRTPPYFLAQPPKQVTARPGDTVVLECPGVGSPPPGAVWSSPNVVNMNNNRTHMLPYGLQINNVLTEDQGSYVCRLDNGIAPALVHIIKFTVLEKPKILRGPARTSANESETLELECSATGNPYPDIYWLINGVDTSEDKEMLHDGRRLVIQHVQKRHAGIVQCFAKNEVGEISEANRLNVNPKQIHGGSTAGGNVPLRLPHEHGGGKNKGKKKHRTATMIPPSRPNVTRLSDDSVMLRWFIPKNDGLPIQFFKVQYRMLGGGSHKLPRENWQTTNDDIPFGKRNRNLDSLKNFTTSVTGLKPDRYYKFRIIAVYSNDDNREGNTSAKFFLQRGDALGLSKSNLPVPILNRVESVSSSAIMLHWSLPIAMTGQSEVDGFYAYYRPTSSAGEYLKATVDGMDTRKFKIDMLESGTAYEFKLQSFNELAASEFSSIIQGKTKKSLSTVTPINEALDPSSKASDVENSVYPLVAGAAGGGILLLIVSVTACLCVKKRKNSQTEDQNKPQLDHMQADFVTPQVLSVSSHHKNGSSGSRLNGVLPRMNITPNPLAQEADKNRNVMELRFMANHSNTNLNTSSSGSSGVTASSNTNKICNAKSNENSSLSIENLNGSDCHNDYVKELPHRASSSSCETLQAGEGICLNYKINSKSNTTGSPLSKPLPPLPNKHNAAGKSSQAQQHQQQQQQQQHINPNKSSLNSKSTSTINHVLNNSSQAGQGIHHAEPYYQTTPNTPTMLTKRDYQHQQPPPVPPHQNNNHNISHSQLPPHPPLTPSLEQQRRTLDRSQRNLPYPSSGNETALSMEAGLPTRIPSLRRIRRTSGGNSGCSTANANNSNGSIGIPISSSPRVQRSPMPSRAAIMKQRSRLGSHNDNISSGSLNSIEV